MMNILPNASNSKLKIISVSYKEIIFYCTIFFYIIYPCWFLPIKPLYQCFILNIFFFLALFNSRVIPSWNIQHSIIIPRFPKIGTVSTVIIWCIGIIGILHIPFFLLPIPFGGDYQTHAGTAARFIDLLSLTPYLPLIIWFIIAVGLFFLRKNKRYFSIKLTNTFLLYTRTKVIVWIIVHIYFLILTTSGLIQRNSINWESFYRYPPLGKIITATGYMLCGIHEFVPRIIQFLFLIGMVYMIYRTACIKNHVQQNPIIYACMLLFPSFFHFSHYSLLTGGVLFFSAAISFYLLSYIMHKKEVDLLLFVIYLILFMLYKRLVFFMIPCLLLITGIVYFQSLISISELKSIIRSIIYSLIVGLPFTIIGTLTHIRSTSISIRNIFNFHHMVSGVYAFHLSTGWILTFLCGIGFMYCLLYRKSLITIYWMLFGITYYTFLQLSGAAGYMRHNQPFYLAAAFLLYISLNEVSEKLKNRNFLRLLLIATLGTYCIYLNIFQDNPIRSTLLFPKQIYYPYKEVMHYIKQHIPGYQRIYAPMDVEPSNFYLAKYKLSKRISWVRKDLIPFNGDIKQYLNVLNQKHFTYLFIMNADIKNNKIIFEELINTDGNIFNKKIFFTYRKNIGILLQLNK